MSPNFTYHTYPLPSPLSSPTPPPTISLLAKKYASLRLDALLTSPGAFGSTHSIESSFTQKDWEARIWRAGMVILVCVARPVRGNADETHTESNGDVELLEGEWVGSSVFLGPVPKASYQLPEESGGPELGSDAEESRWQMTALYTSPEHRGKGLAKNIIRTAMAYAKSHTLNASPSSKRARVRIIIRPGNDVIASLYKSLGFVDAGKCTGIEGFKANGDEDLLEAKMASGKDYEILVSRKAVVMEALVNF